MKFRASPAIVRGDGSSIDALSIGKKDREFNNFMVDHCSFSWAVDENIDVWYSTNNLTFSNNIISEGLRFGNHPDQQDQGHSKGLLQGGNDLANGGNVSVVRNLFAHNSDRNPRFTFADGDAEIINNVFYNYGEATYVKSEDEGPGVKVDIIGNYYKPGPNSYDGSYNEPIYLRSTDIEISAFIEHNLDSKFLPGPSLHDQSSLLEDSSKYTVLSDSHNNLSVATSAGDAYEQIVGKGDVGANAYVNCRGERVLSADPIDRRIIQETKEGAGSWIDCPTQSSCTDSRATSWILPEDYNRFGIADEIDDSTGLPTASSNSSCTFAKNSKTPDEFNVKWGIAVPNATQDTDGDGFPDFEEYLNATDPTNSDNSIIYASDQPSTPTSTPTPFIGNNPPPPTATPAQDDVTYDINSNLLNAYATNNSQHDLNKDGIFNFADVLLE